RPPGDYGRFLRARDPFIARFRRQPMRYLALLIVASACLFAYPATCRQVYAVQNKPAAPLHVGVVGLVHGHVLGFFRESQGRPDLKIVGIAESDQELAARYASRYGLDRSLLF